LGQEDFLLLESDLIYEKRALQEALGSNSPNRLLVSGPTLSGDEVYVEAEGTQLRQLSKNRAILGGKVVGELVGITRISAPLHQAMREAASKYFSLNPYLEYEQALVMASARHIVECHLVQDLIWSEIDDEQHLARAREEVYPRILARDGGLRG
jgi:2-aminoethylphosphonate-pyruvate transaminase